MRFEWDEKKAAANLDKHGVSFGEATTVFGDPLSIPSTILIIRYEERRFLIIGVSDRGRMLIVAHTDDGKVVRIISARESTTGEIKSYAES